MMATSLGPYTAVNMIPGEWQDLYGNYTRSRHIKEPVSHFPMKHFHEIIKGRLERYFDKSFH